MANDEPRPGYRFIYVSSYWNWGLKRRVYAYEFGYRAIRLEVRIDGPRRQAPDRQPGTQHAAPAAPVPRRRTSKTPRR